MRLATRRIFFCLLFAVIAAGRPAELPAAGNPPREGVHFLWAVGAISAKTRAFSPIRADTNLHTGDEIKLGLKLIRPGFIYLLHQDSRQQFHLLMPRSIDAAEQPLKTNLWHYIPSGPPWFKLDERIGAEKIILVAAPERQAPLEAAIAAAQSAPEAKRAQAAAALSAELRALRRAALGLDGVAERVTSVGGTLRGNDDPPDIAQHALEVTSPGLFCRTITIDHKP